MDQKQKNVSAEQVKINIYESYQVDHWSRKFGVSKDKLKAVVQTVGASVDVVEEYLKK